MHSQSVALQVGKDKIIIDRLQGVSISFLASSFGIRAFDMLKIDIEGSEKELLTPKPGNDLSWLDGASMVMLEVHEDMRIGSHKAVANTFSERAKSWRYVKKYGEYFLYKKEEFDKAFDALHVNDTEPIIPEDLINR